VHDASRTNLWGILLVRSSHLLRCSVVSQMKTRSSSPLSSKFVSLLACTLHTGRGLWIHQAKAGTIDSPPVHRLQTPAAGDPPVVDPTLWPTRG